MIKSILRKLRGIVGTGLTWAAGWSVAGTVLQAVLSLFGVIPSPDLAATPFMWGLFGFLGGATFGAVLSLAEGRRTLEALRVDRVAIWGGLAGLAVSVTYGLLYGLFRDGSNAFSLAFFAQFGLIVAPMSALFAAGMAALAKRAKEPRLGSGTLGLRAADTEDSLKAVEGELADALPDQAPAIV